MPRIAPLPLDQITDPELLEMIQEAETNGLGDTLYLRVVARQPHGAKRLYTALKLAGAQGAVDPAFKEIIRIQLARLAKDTYFSNLRARAATEAGLTEERINAADDFDQADCFSDAEKAALRYARQMYTDHTLNDAAFYDVLKQHYSEAQVMELGSWIGLSWGLAKWMRSLRAFPEHDQQGNLVSQEESERIYGVPVGA
jgi:alkylhydroperoxidase family enzyme